MSGPKIHLGTQYPVQRSEDVDKIIHTPVGDDGTSEWLWITLANGGVIFGCYPRGDTYMDCEVAITEDWQASQHDGTSQSLTVPVSDAVVEDEDPAHPVFAPARGDEQWIGYARAEQAPTSVQFSDQEADQQLDWLLRAVTAEGADVNQRRYDLEQLARLVLDNPQAGYGRMPVDTDVHGPECIICEGKEDFSLNPPGLSRDGHPYTEKVVPGQTLYVVDEDGATFAFLYKPHAERAAAQEFARGAIGLREFTIKAPREVVFWQEDGDNDVLVTLADYACSHGPDIKVKPEFEYLMTAVLETWSGSSREDFDQPGPSEYLRGQVELLLYAGALEAPDGYDNADAKDWLTSHIITRVLLDNQKGNA